MNLFGIGLTELLVVVVISFIVLGPSKSMDMIKNITKTLRQLRKAWEDVKSTVDDVVDETKFNFDYVEKMLNVESEKKEDKSPDG